MNKTENIPYAKLLTNPKNIDPDDANLKGARVFVKKFGKQAVSLEDGVNKIISLGLTDDKDIASTYFQNMIDYNQPVNVAFFSSLSGFRFKEVYLNKNLDKGYKLDLSHENAFIHED